MLSDVLAESADSIRYYLANYPFCYDAVVDQVEQLLKEMDRIRVLLDTPFGVAAIAATSAHRRRLQGEQNPREIPPKIDKRNAD